MQELIEYAHDLDFGGWEEVFIRKATELLEKEKEQIIAAVEDTRSNIVPKMFLKENLSGEQYYNQTYNQNK